MLANLGTTPFAEVLRKTSAERRSGDLEVRATRVAKTVFFDRGRLVFAASSLKDDRLGEALVALGRISPREFEHASALMRQPERRRRFGEALVQAGVMDKNELGHSVARQVGRIVLSLFPLSDGAASFEDRPCPIPLEYMVNLSVHRLLYQGIKRMEDPALIRAGLGDLDRVVSLTTVCPFRFSLERCGSEELEILQRCRRPTAIRQLVATRRGLDDDRLRLAYALHASGVIQTVPAKGAAAEPQPVVEMETGNFLLSTLQRRPDPSVHEAIRQEVRQELASSAALDRTTWLHVSSTAPREVLIQAIQDKVERYHVLLENAGDEPDLQTDLELILGRASALLRLAKRTAPPPAAPEPSPSPPRSAEEPRAAADAVEPDGGAEGETPTPSGASDTRAYRPDEPAGEKPPAPPPEPDARARQPGLEFSQGQLTLLLMEAEARMAVSDYANAVRTYIRIIELQPASASLRIKLAIAMALWPKTTRLAEREFLEALRLEPNNADFHFQFGLYYKAMKLRNRALQQIRTAVSLNPRHNLALRELRALSPKDSALSSLKGLFG